MVSVPVGAVPEGGAVPAGTAAAMANMAIKSRRSVEIRMVGMLLEGTGGGEGPVCCLGLCGWAVGTNAVFPAGTSCAPSLDLG